MYLCAIVFLYTIIYTCAHIHTYTCLYIYRHYLESQLAVAWGGRVAEELVFGQSKVRIMTLNHISCLLYMLFCRVLYKTNTYAERIYIYTACSIYTVYICSLHVLTLYMLTLYMLYMILYTGNNRCLRRSPTDLPHRSCHGHSARYIYICRQYCFLCTIIECAILFYFSI